MGGGIRQGDPLLSFLFKIAAKGLFILFQRAVVSNIFPVLILALITSCIIFSTQMTQMTLLSLC